MEKAIYKIENQINHKIYIGQSQNPKRRFKEHCNTSYAYTSLVSQAIQKYGADNFTFEILGWFEDYNEKEKYYISLYRSLAPYGYNILPGGQEPPILKGDKNPHTVISLEEAKHIQQQLLDWRIPKKTVVSNNHVTSDIVRHINEGHSWRDDTLSYPLRPSEKELDKYRVLYIQWKCCSSDIPLNDLGKLVGWARSSAKMINRGENHYDPRFTYPLRANKEKNLQILNQEPCIDYLHFEE